MRSTISFLKGDFFKDTAFVFAAQMVLNGSNYAYHFIVSRRLGVEQYGLVYSLLALLVIVSIPASIGTVTIARIVSELNAVGDREKISVLARRSLKGFGGAGLAVVAGCALLATPLASYLHTNSYVAIDSIGIVIGINFVLPILRGFLQGMQKFRSLAVSYAVEGIGKLVAGAGLVAAGLGAAGALTGVAVAGLLAALLCLLAMRHAVDLRSGGRTFIDARRLVIVTAGVAVTTAATSSLAYADSILVKHLFSPADAGLYSVVSLIGKMLLFAVSFVPILVLPKATNLIAQQQSPRRVLVQSAALFAAVGSVGLLALFIAPRAIVGLTAGHAYLAAAPFVFQYGVAMFALGGINIVAYYKIGIHQFDFVAPLAVIAVIEIAAVLFWHSSIRQVILILTIGNGAALLASCYRIHEYKRSAAAMKRASSVPSTA